MIFESETLQFEIHLHSGQLNVILFIKEIPIIVGWYKNLRAYIKDVCKKAYEHSQVQMNTRIFC